MASSESSVQRYLKAMASAQTRQKYQEGIDQTTVNPMQMAADAEQLYLDRVQESVSSGRRKAKLLATPVSRWKDNAKGAGADRLSTGAAKAADKMRAHFTKFGPIYDDIKKQVAQMPKGGIAESLARVEYTIRRLKDAAGKAA